MRYQEFLKRVVDESIVAAKRDYEDNTNKRHFLEGSIAGLEACRDLSPPQLALLLERARNVQQQALHATTIKRYWRINCFLNEVEWISNVISAMLRNQDMPIIVQPTMRGLMMAARIISGASTAEN